MEPESKREMTDAEITEHNARVARLSVHGDKIGSLLADLIETARDLRADCARSGSPGRQMSLVVTNLEQAALWQLLVNAELGGAQVADGCLTDMLRGI